MSRAQGRKKTVCSIIALDKFIQATRDSGYRGTPSAVSELIDNAIQANATVIAVSVVASTDGDGSRKIELSVLDNGCGMDPFTLREALRFGGTTRFGDRRGLGRYGMGLPNASLSQCRRVTVYTWQSPGRERQSRRGGPRRSSKAKEVYVSYLDIDEIVQGNLQEVPRPKIGAASPAECSSPSGTLVRWSQCDRLDNTRVSTIARKLSLELGRRFRHFLWRGLDLTINGKRVDPIDPLYLHPRAQMSGAIPFGDKLRFEVYADESGSGPSGWVEAQFSELPVHEWYRLSNQEKRRIGISSGAGVSIVRGGREVDVGWFFMGKKRRENYDDWWRCEVQFDPVLDEAFGITHTKQQIRPQAHLLEALTPDLEATARALNSRARKAHTAAKLGERFSEAERLASRRDHLLRPLPRRTTERDRTLLKEFEKATPPLLPHHEEDVRYRIIEHRIKSTWFFNYAHDGDCLTLAINPDHPFYREIYRPLAEGDSPQEQQLRVKIELLLLAAARSEAGMVKRTKPPRGKSFFAEWSDTLAAFLNG